MVKNPQHSTHGTGAIPHRRPRAIVSGFQSTVRDTALRRDLEPDLHYTLGMIAFAERKATQAIAEFRRGDLAPDGPKNACTICLPLDLGRAIDAANQPDSAIVQFEL